MKANRRFVEGEDAVSAVIGVILMVAITVAIAATVYVYVSGMLGTGPATTPTVSMVQGGTSFISITKVENGPVKNDSTCIAIMINDTSGTAEGTAKIIGTGGDDTKIEGGDLIQLSDYSTEAGWTYTIQLKYGDDVVGTCKFSS